jgi:rotatin
LSYVPLVPNAASLKMVTEICNVMLRCIEIDLDLLVDMMARNVTAMFVLVHLLNLDHYDDFGDDLLISTTTSIMKVLYALASTDVGRFFIESTFQKIEFVDLIEFFNDGFAVDRQKSFQMTCMRLFIQLIKPKVLQPAEAIDTFAQLLERHKVKIPSEYHQSDGDGGSETNEKIKRISQEYLNHTNGMNGEVKLKRKHYFGSELLFAQLSALFDSLCDQDKPQNGYIGEKKLSDSHFNSLLTNFSSRYRPKTRLHHDYSSPTENVLQSGHLGSRKQVHPHHYRTFGERKCRDRRQL